MRVQCFSVSVFAVQIQCNAAKSSVVLLRYCAMAVLYVFFFHSKSYVIAGCQVVAYAIASLP